MLPYTRVRLEGSGRDAGLPITGFLRSHHSLSDLMISVRIQTQGMQQKSIDIGLFF